MMCVTVLASHPSVSIDTETTQRISAPSRPARPTVFMTSRRISASVRFVGLRGSPRSLLFALEFLDLARRRSCGSRPKAPRRIQAASCRSGRCGSAAASGRSRRHWKTAAACPSRRAFACCRPRLRSSRTRKSSRKRASTSLCCCRRR